MEEIRMYLYGTEAKLCPVNSFNYLKNLKAARSFARENDNMAEAEMLAFWAGMLSDSAYDGEEKLFSSLYDVMEKLTADEIASAAQDIFYQVKFPEIKDDIGKGRGAQKRESAASERSDGAAPESPAAAASDSYGENAAKNAAPYYDIPKDGRSKKEITVGFGQRKIGGGEYSIGNGGSYGGFGGRVQTAESAAAAEEFSEFFERDSRRYDRTY